MRSSPRHFSKLTYKDIADIRRLYAAGGITQAALAKRYRVSAPYINNIVLRKTR